MVKVPSLGLWRFQILSSMGFSLTKIAYHLSRFLCKHFTRKAEPSLIHDWASIRNWKMEELTLQDRYLRIDKILFFPLDLFCHQQTLFYKLVSSLRQIYSFFLLFRGWCNRYGLEPQQCWWKDLYQIFFRWGTKIL